MFWANQKGISLFFAMEFGHTGLFITMNIKHMLMSCVGTLAFWIVDKVFGGFFEMLANTVEHDCS